MTRSSTYALDPSQAEIDRLLMLSRLTSDEVAHAGHKAGLKPGDWALDLGCGALGALPALARLVGPSGRAVGLDQDPGALAMARRVLDADGMGWVDLVHANFDQADLPSLRRERGFDLIYCRLFLMHQHSPLETLRRMTELLGPGGCLAVVDMVAGPTCEPSSRALERAWSLIVESMRIRRASPGVAKRYASLCAEAGLEVVRQRGLFQPRPPAEVFQDVSVLLQGARRTIVDGGAAGSGEIDLLLTELNDASSVAFACSPSTIELIARRPGNGEAR